MNRYLIESGHKIKVDHCDDVSKEILTIIDSDFIYVFDRIIIDTQKVVERIILVLTNGGCMKDLTQLKLAAADCILMIIDPLNRSLRTPLPNYGNGPLTFEVFDIRNENYIGTLLSPNRAIVDRDLRLVVTLGEIIEVEFI